MNYLKMLSLFLDRLSGLSWWLNFGLIFLIIIASTANKMIRFLHNLITSKQLKILFQNDKIYIVLYLKILHYLWALCVLLLWQTVAVAFLQYIETCKRCNSCEIYRFDFQWEIVSNLSCPEGYFNINANCFQRFCYISAKFLRNLFYVRNC